MEPETKEGTPKYNWPDKNTFIRYRDAFVEKHAPDYAKQLARDENMQEFKLTPRQIEAVAKILQRVYFTANLLLESAPIKLHARVDVFPTVNIANYLVAANTATMFSLDGKLVDLNEINATNVQDAKLERIQVEINIHRIISRVRNVDEILEHMFEAGEISEDELKETIDQNIEDASQDQERWIVEEIAHVFYWMSKSSSPSKLLELIEEYSQYKTADKSARADNNEILKIFSDYSNSPIEKHAQIWVRRYLQNYYPDSVLRRIAKQRKIDTGDTI